MIAWEWTLEKAGEVEVEKKATTRKISQTAQVQERGGKSKTDSGLRSSRSHSEILKLHTESNCSTVSSVFRPLMIPVTATTLNQ